MSTRVKFLYGLTCCLGGICLTWTWTVWLSRIDPQPHVHVANNSYPVIEVNSKLIYTGHTSDTVTISPVRFPTWVNGKDINPEIAKYFTMTQNETRDPFVNFHQFKYTLNSEVCVGRKLFLAMSIHSAPRNIHLRKYIRTTFGTVKAYKNKQIAVVFFIGLVSNEADQKVINSESKNYKDIVQGNFRDDYRNLIRKHIMAMHWFTVNCVAEYILKLDDDTFVNPYRTVDYLIDQSPRGMVMHCCVIPRAVPIRNAYSKWYTPKSQYPFSVFPPFCLGFAYFTTPQTWSAMLRVSTNTRKMNMDDVYVSVVLAMGARVSKVDIHKRVYPCPGPTKKIDVRALNTKLLFMDPLSVCGTRPFETWTEIRNMNTPSGGH